MFTVKPNYFEFGWTFDFNNYFLILANWNCVASGGTSAFSSNHNPYFGSGSYVASHGWTIEGYVNDPWQQVSYESDLSSNFCSCFWRWNFLNWRGSPPWWGPTVNDQGSTSNTIITSGSPSSSPSKNFLINTNTAVTGVIIQFAHILVKYCFSYE